MLCRPSNKGFTLVEILVALILFTLGVLLAARMQNTSIKSTTFGSEALVATNAAQTLMEQLKEQPTLGTASFNTLLLGGGPGPVCTGMTIATIKSNTVSGTQLIPGMTIQWTVSNLNGSAGSRYATVTVTVQWTSNRSYSATTVISESSPGGFSLVELMVALAIAGFLSIGLWALMGSQNKTYAVQDNASQMQQNLRAAINMISADLRTAGQGPAWQMTMNGNTTTWYSLYPAQGTITFSFGQPYSYVANSKQLDMIGIVGPAGTGGTQTILNAAVAAGQTRSPWHRQGRVNTSLSARTSISVTRVATRARK